MSSTQHRMKGIAKRFIDNDDMLESIVEDNGNYITINRLTKCIAIYGKNLGLSKDSVILLIKEFRLYSCSEGNYSSSYEFDLGPRVWWLQMHESPLKEIALRLLQIKPNSAGLEYQGTALRIAWSNKSSGQPSRYYFRAAGHIWRMGY
jgi:hypothetical protein